MHLSINAAGIRDAANTAIATQIDSLRQSGVSWPIAASVRDHIGSLLATLPADEAVSVRATVDISIVHVAPAPQPAYVPPAGLNIDP